MSNDYFDDDLDLDENDESQDEPQRNPLRQQVRRLERQLKDANKKAEEAQKAARENAFLKAGINPDDPKFKYFVKGYDGDLTKDAIAAEAATAGLLAAPEPKDAIPAEEREAHQRIADTGRGSEPRGGRDWDSEIRNAENRDQAMRLIKEREAAEQ